MNYDVLIECRRYFVKPVFLTNFSIHTKIKLAEILNISVIRLVSALVQSVTLV